MKAAAFEHHPARSVEHALALLAEFAPSGGRIIAGGQSLVPIMAFRMAQPPHLIDINTIPELDRLQVEAGALHVPAGVRHEALRRAPAGPSLRALLREICGHIAHLPIRTRGTFCGSLAHADPSSEWCLVFAALGGVAVIRSLRGTREVEAGGYFLGVMETALAADEMLVAVRLALPPDDMRLGFFEVSRRAGDYAMAMAMVGYRLVGGRMTDARVALGGVEVSPRRLSSAEAVLDGAVPDEAAFAAAAAAAAAAIDPMVDPQATAAFRRDLARAVVARALRQACRAD